MAKQRVDLPRFERVAQVRSESFNADDNTIEIVWTTGASVRRYDYWDGNEYDEVLSLDDGAIRLERLNLGAPFLDTHCSYSLDKVIGSVVPESARITDGKGLCRILLSKADGVKDTVQKIREGVIRNISVGYWIHKVVKTEGERGKIARWDVVDWEPLEVSAVPIPADPGSQVRTAQRDAAGGAKPELRSCTFVINPKQPARAPQRSAQEGTMKVRSTKTSTKRGGKAPAEMTEDEKRLAQLEAATRAAERAGGSRADADDEDEDDKKDDEERDAEEDGEKDDEKSDDERDGDADGEGDDDEERDAEEDDADDKKKEGDRAAPRPAPRKRAALTEAEVRKAAEAAVRADRVRGSQIREIGAQFGFPRLADKHAAGETSVRAFKDLVLERLAKRQKERGNTTFAAAGTAGTGEDEASRSTSGTAYGRDMDKGAAEARALLGLK